jgi:cell division protein FtsI (penicillin-binding protein 3)
MKVEDKKWIRIRIYLVAVFFLCGLTTILLRASQLQVFERERLDALARAGYNDVVKLLPKRGTIYDREGHELAVSVEVGSIYANPRLIDDKVKSAAQLALHLNIPQSSILSLLEKDSPFVWIERRLSPEKIRQVKALGLNGVGFTSESGRYYPGMDIAGHLLGFVGSDNQGLEGLEKKYDDVLTGPQRTLVQMVDALGRPFFIGNPDPGNNQNLYNLILTIDKDIQYKAQQALEEALEDSKGKSGQCLIMDPVTGEMLAMAVAPSFNPNIFREYSPGQWRNRTITDCYEPGSAIKAFLLAAALDKKVVAPSTKFYCEDGQYKVATHQIHDTKKYGTLSVSDIVILSSNIGALKIGQVLGYSNYYEYLKRFGFGDKTGIELIGERQGIVRSPEAINLVEQSTIFFGQGISVTSLQLVNAMAAIANGGKLMRPYVVKAMTDESGRIVKEFHPQMIRRVVSEEISHKITSILEDVVSERGTAPLATITGYRVAGKTGTAQKVNPLTKGYSDEDYVAIFVGFVPVKEPRLVILVMIDEPKGSVYGGAVAGPVFKEVGKWALNSMRVNPEIRLVETIRESPQDNSESPDKPIMIREANLLPDFQGKTMREVLKRGNELGLDVLIDGSGMAISQEPGPGSPLDGITSIKVSFRPPV